MSNYRLDYRVVPIVNGSSFYYRLINIALRYTRLLNTLEIYTFAARGLDSFSAVLNYLLFCLVDFYSSFLFCTVLFFYSSQ